MDYTEKDEQQLPDMHKLTEIIAPEVSALGFDLVRVKWLVQGGDEGNDPALQIMAERPETGQLVIEDCAALSRRLSEKFDAMEEAGNDPVDQAYRLEVSSPGIDRPLTRLADFGAWAGHEAKVELSKPAAGRKKLRGDLSGTDGDIIVMEDRKAGEVRFTLDDVDNAKLILTDRLIAASAPVDSDGVDVIDEDSDVDDEFTDDEFTDGETGA